MNELHTFHLTLTPADADNVLAGLSELPLKASLATFQSVHRQLKEQSEAASGNRQEGPSHADGEQAEQPRELSLSGLGD